MQTINVKLKDRSYPIHLAPDLLGQVGRLARAQVGDKPRAAVVVSNPTVNRLYGQAVMRSCQAAGFHAHNFLIGDGETYKTAATAQLLYTFLIERRIERADVIVALGGGVVGDLAGFVAATYLRGVPLIHLPTTLLAQIDSSVGGKTGINHRLGKNLIGAFHQPALVVIDPQTLHTLPPRELTAGLCEAIKYGVIKDRRLFLRLARDLDKLKQLDQESLAHLIARSCQIKAQVVAADEREGGLRRILNFGHTIGHALEAVTRYRRFLHGEAVGHGMRAAAVIAKRLGLLAAADCQAIHDLIARVGRLPETKSIALDAIIEATYRDKKSAAGKVAFVLPVEIGRVTIQSDVPLKIIRTALKESLS